MNLGGNNKSGIDTVELLSEIVDNINSEVDHLIKIVLLFIKMNPELKDDILYKASCLTYFKMNDEWTIGDEIESKLEELKKKDGRESGGT